jgi:hypothetical protein
MTLEAIVNVCSIHGIIGPYITMHLLKDVIIQGSDCIILHGEDSTIAEEKRIGMRLFQLRSRKHMSAEGLQGVKLGDANR